MSPGVWPRCWGWSTCPVKSTWRSWVCSVQSKDSFRESYSTPQCFTGKILGRWSHVPHSGSRTRDNGQTETRAVLTGKNPYSLKNSPAVQQVVQSLPLEVFKTQLDKVLSNLVRSYCSPALSRKLDWRPPEVTSNWPSLQVNDSEISTPTIVKIQANFDMFGSNYKFVVRLKENRKRL